MTIDILAFGEALIDVLPSGEVVGGAPLNFATRCAEIGAAADLCTGLASCIGQDARGDRILAQLTSAQVDTRLVTTSQVHETGFVMVDVSSAEAQYRFSDEPAWNEITVERARDFAPQLIYFGSLALKSACNLESLYSLTKDSEAIHLLDLNLRLPYPSPTLVAELLSIATVLKCNTDELRWLASELNLNPESVDAITRELIDRYSLAGVLSTWGQEGCRWHTLEGTTQDPDPEFPVDLYEKHPQADTVGAGDAACAALAIGLILGNRPQKLVRECNLAGGFAARVQGPTHPMPEDVLQQFSTHKTT